MGNRKREVEVVDDQTLHCCCICLSANISRIPQPHILCVRNRLASAFQFCWLVLLALRGRSHLHFCFLWSKTEWEKITVLYFCVWPIVNQLWILSTARGLRISKLWPGFYGSFHKFISALTVGRSLCLRDIFCSVLPAKQDRFPSNFSSLVFIPVKSTWSGSWKENGFLT